MFTRDVRFEGFSVESWIRFLDLWRENAGLFVANPTPTEELPTKRLRAS